MLLFIYHKIIELFIIHSNTLIDSGHNLKLWNRICWSIKQAFVSLDKSIILRKIYNINIFLARLKPFFKNRITVLFSLSIFLYKQHECWNSKKEMLYNSVEFKFITNLFQIVIFIFLAVFEIDGHVKDEKYVCLWFDFFVHFYTIHSLPKSTYSIYSIHHD